MKGFNPVAGIRFKSRLEQVFTRSSLKYVSIPLPGFVSNQVGATPKAWEYQEGFNPVAGIRFKSSKRSIER